MTPNDSHIFVQALSARDARFDGVFFVGITTTRIYCRPVCPSRAARNQHRRFFSSAAAAETAGFRPCLRCRPELAPGCALCDAVSRLASTAVHRISAGALNERSVGQLASELGVSERHLRRALDREIGVSPVELAQTHRLLLAKRLLADTRLSVTTIAFASGFQSLRRFNSVFRERYGLSPTSLRQGRVARSQSHERDTVALTLAYRPPLAWDALVALLRADAITGVEVAEENRYARTVRIDGRTGVIVAENASGNVKIDVSLSLLPVLMPLLARLRHLFDLDAEPATVDTRLEQGGLQSLVAQRRGLRLLGTFDAFELVLRALLAGRARPGAGSNAVVARVFSALGQPIETGIASLSHLAPTADRIAEAGPARLKDLGVASRRADAISRVARIVADGQLRLEPGSDALGSRDALIEIDGISDRLATTIVMRALRWPDAFPASDVSLQRAAGVPNMRSLLDRAEDWRPWRAYAALHLWINGEDRPCAP